MATSNQRLMPNSSTDLTASGNKRRGTGAAEHHHRKKSRMMSGMCAHIEDKLEKYIVMIC